MGDRITYVGLDLHKEGIVVDVTENGVRGEVWEYSRSPHLAGRLCHASKTPPGNWATGCKVLRKLALPLDYSCGKSWCKCDCS
jgi:hypothetical protein